MSDLRATGHRHRRMPGPTPTRIGCIAAEARKASPHG
jgi:hypothetical protein